MYRCLVILLFPLALLSACQQPPDGTNYASPRWPAGEVVFLRDLTWTHPHEQQLQQQGRQGQAPRQLDQQIFDEVFALIKSARRYVVVDMFLFNDFQGPSPELSRALSEELTQSLILKQAEDKAIKVILITDPVNNVYGGYPSAQLQRLREAGVKVILTDLDQLRDSNPLYSTMWRLFIRPFGASDANTIANPLGPGRVSLRSLLRLLNFKANHRKLVITDQGDSAVAVVTSANPHDGSSAHGNVGVRFNGPAALELLRSETAVLAFSGAPGLARELMEIVEAGLQVFEAPPEAETSVQVVTEAQIKKAVLAVLNQAQRDDAIELLMFYLSDRDVIAALKQAHERDVKVRVILDPNKDAFGRSKQGIPNRPVAAELSALGIPVRWCDTHGEQCHSKLLIHRPVAGSDAAFVLGSANFTRRNLDNFNLETDVVVRAAASSKVISDAQAYFELMWHNSPNRSLTVDYSVYEKDSWWQTLRYRFTEATGLSTF